jgi:single-stranded DNA-binding protein
MNEGRGYVIGNLVRDWERKEVNVKGTKKILWKNRVAHQPTKHDETVFVDITVWPYETDDTLGRTISETVGKGKPVAAYGKLTNKPYTAKDGTEKPGWQIDAFRVAAEIRKPWTGDSPASSNAVKDAFPGATEKKYDDTMMEPF